MLLDPSIERRVSMFTDKIESTKKIMQRSKQAEEKIDQHQKYQDFYETVKREKQRMILITDAISALHHYDDERFPKADLRQILRKLTDILSTFEAEPKKRQLHFLAKDLEEKSEVYKERWITFAASATEEATRTLHSIRGLVTDKKEIDDVISSLKKISELWPVTEKNVIYFESLLQEAKSKVTRLQVSPSIQQFLEKVANQQANLSDLTPEITEWLNQQDFSKNLTISFKRG